MLITYLRTVMVNKENYYREYKEVNRKVQGMPQSQTAANPRHQEGEKKDKNIHAQNTQTNVREAQRSAPSSPSEVIRMLKQTEKRGQRAREDFRTLSAPWYKPRSNTKLRTTPAYTKWRSLISSHNCQNFFLAWHFFIHMFIISELFVQSIRKLQ